MFYNQNVLSEISERLIIFGYGTGYHQEMLIDRSNALEKLLYSEIAGEWYAAVHALYEQYSTITGVSAFPSVNQPIMLPDGKAISIDGAAHCLLEPKRTAFFLRGIYKALQHFFKQANGRPIRILYAGCGPYATLITPLLTLFEPENLTVDLLDINERSLHVVKILWQELGLKQFADNFILADATSFIPDDPQGIDLVISETLNAGLKSEPFVSIVENLVPKLRNDAFFIPELVSVYVSIGGPGGKSLVLGEVGKVGRNFAFAPHPVSFVLPSTTWIFDRIRLQTEVLVYGDFLLRDMDTSLTLAQPVKLYDLHEGETIAFSYEKGKNPGFRYAKL